MTAQLKSSSSMASSLVRRQLGDKLDALRIRADNDHRCGVTPSLRKAEQAIMAGRYPDAGRFLQDAEEKLDQRAAAREAAAAAEAAERQARRRGVLTAHTPGGPSTRDGFLWLVKKGRVTPHRRDAGQRYGELYARARGDSIKSALNDNVGGRAGDSPADARLRAVFDLDAANLHIYRAMGEAHGRRLVALLEAVCGIGTTLREVAGGDDRKAAILEADLMTALDMEAIHFGVCR
ncbi:hypothetical protein SGCZBJ_03770 [Caulobacter zeae]|uniref:Uncharacterized protein n=1 Tax=Caulobacter zeae TaxID=2055137 RepID=A0A2N5DQ04_9CAUL|nr:hypothetical protein [Caulobacter zeae]PLR28136.1 hypothetical protein SGCZBJ_03770 [Caulobacter zeae]